MEKEAAELEQKQINKKRVDVLDEDPKNSNEEVQKNEL